MQGFPNFKKTFPKFRAHGLASLFPRADPELVAFMGRFLELDRKQRISASEALKHPIFKRNLTV